MTAHSFTGVPQSFELSFTTESPFQSSRTRRGEPYRTAPVVPGGAITGPQVDTGSRRHVTGSEPMRGLKPLSLPSILYDNTSRGSRRHGVALSHDDAEQLRASLAALSRSVKSAMAQSSRLDPNTETPYSSEYSVIQNGGGSCSQGRRRGDVHPLALQAMDPNSAVNLRIRPDYSLGQYKNSAGSRKAEFGTAWEAVDVKSLSAVDLGATSRAFQRQTMSYRKPVPTIEEYEEVERKKKASIAAQPREPVVGTPKYSQSPVISDQNNSTRHFSPPAGQRVPATAPLKLQRRSIFRKILRPTSVNLQRNPPTIPQSQAVQSTPSIWAAFTFPPSAKTRKEKHKPIMSDHTLGVFDSLTDFASGPSPFKIRREAANVGSGSTHEDPPYGRPSSPPVHRASVGVQEPIALNLPSPETSNIRVSPLVGIGSKAALRASTQDLSPTRKHTAGTRPSLSSSCRSSDLEQRSYSSILNAFPSPCVSALSTNDGQLADSEKPDTRLIADRPQPMVHIDPDFVGFGPGCLTPSSSMRARSMSEGVTTPVSAPVLMEKWKTTRYRKSLDNIRKIFGSSHMGQSEPVPEIPKWMSSAGDKREEAFGPALITLGRFGNEKMEVEQAGGSYSGTVRRRRAASISGERADYKCGTDRDVMPAVTEANPRSQDGDIAQEIALEGSDADEDKMDDEFDLEAEQRDGKDGCAQGEHVEIVEHFESDMDTVGRIRIEAASLDEPDRCDRKGKAPQRQR